MARKDHDYVSPVFDILNVPQSKEVKAKQCQTIREMLPKALSGSDALKMLREREKTKRKQTADEIAKEVRKKERKEKKKIKMAAAEQMKRERNENKKMQKENRQKKPQKAKKPKRSLESDFKDEASVSVPYFDDSDSYSEEFQPCPGCGGFAGQPTIWVTCEICLIRWHAKCANRLEFELLDDDGLKTIDFNCDDCV